MKIPTIPEIPDVVEVLRLVSSSPLYVERLTMLRDLQNQINKQLVTLDQHQDITAALAQARTKLAEAETTRRKADEYAATRKADADAAYNRSVDGISRREAEIKSAQAQLAQQAHDLAIKGVELNRRETELNAEKERVGKFQAEALEAKAAADRLRAIYDDKLRQLKAVTG